MIFLIGTSEVSRTRIPDLFYETFVEMNNMIFLCLAKPMLDLNYLDGCFWQNFGYTFIVTNSTSVNKL